MTLMVIIIALSPHLKDACTSGFKMKKQMRRQKNKFTKICSSSKQPTMQRLTSQSLHTRPHV